MLQLVPLSFFYLVLVGNVFQASVYVLYIDNFFQVYFSKCYLVKNARRVFFMVVSLSTAIVFTCYSWEGCNYDKRISPKFSLPFFQWIHAIMLNYRYIFQDGINIQSLT